VALRSVDDTLHQLLADAPLWGSELRDLEHALGGILAVDVFAEMDVPPADNSAMDGYALRLADLGTGMPLPVGQRIPAGAAGCALEAGTAARIFTGASIPVGADTVVAQEDCELDGEILTVKVTPRLGQHIRPQGQDIAKGQLILTKGSQLSAADLGLLASLGVASVAVTRRIRVALMSTGDELREPGEVLVAGQIYNSNRPMLAALIRSLGAEVVDLGIVADTPQATKEALEKAANSADIVMNVERRNCINSHWMPTVILPKSCNLEKRNSFIKILINQGIQVRPFFYPVSNFPMFSNVYGNQISYDLYQRGINLPSYFEMTEHDITYVTGALISAIND
jgi:molybdopterin molybdotransferase